MLVNQMSLYWLTGCNPRSLAIPNLETEPNLGGVSHDAVVAPVVVVVVVIIVVVPFVVVVVVAVGADD